MRMGDGGGVTQHTMGSDTSTAISNLLLATGIYMTFSGFGSPIATQTANITGTTSLFIPMLLEEAEISKRILPV
jgi:predicted molibdopterin-dependent oxidoreductase YjgC